MLKIIGSVLLLFSLSGYYLTKPYEQFETHIQNTELKPDTKVLVAITYIEEGSNADQNDLFWENNSAVIDDLENQSGLLGYSVRKELFGNRAWTMTTWRDTASMKKFRRSTYHKKAMNESIDAAQKAGFAKVWVAYARIPLDWEEAEVLFEKHAVYY